MRGHRVTHQDEPSLLFNRAVALTEEGALSAAIESYREVAAAGDGELAARARFNLAHLRVETGELTGAAEAFEQVIATGDCDAAPKATFNLGCVLEATGDLAGAVHAFTRARETGHEDVVRNAARQLVRLGGDAARLDASVALAA